MLNSIYIYVAVTVAGKSLNISYDPSTSPAPEILVALCNEFERRLETEPDSIIPSFSSIFSISLADTKLWNELSTDVSTIAPSLYPEIIKSWKTPDIAMFIRRYLRELPEPLIPTNLYDDYVHAGKLQIDSEALLTMEKLIVNSLNLHHSMCVQFFGSHLGRLCSLADKWSVANGHIVNAEKILSTFYSTVLLRPPWENIMYVFAVID